MFLSIKDGHRRLVGRMDCFSEKVRCYTYNFGPIVFPKAVIGERGIPSRWASIIEASLVFLILAALALFSRTTQYQAMTERLSDYFLPGLINISTTHDAGYFLYQALTWQNLLREGGGTLLDVGLGELPGAILAALALALELPLERTALAFVYAAVSLSAFSVYLFFAAQRQGALGLATAALVIFYFPVYSRTSVGMFDTDQLNLFFVMLVLTLLIISQKSPKTRTSITLVFFAGVVNYIFLLWYPRPGFLIAFLLTLLSLGIYYKNSLRNIVLGAIVFCFASGVYQITSSWNSLTTFFGLYVDRGSSNLLEIVTSGESFKSIIFPTIQEIQTISSDAIKRDFSSVLVLSVSCTGVIIWILQDIRRLFAATIPILFLLLYFYSGQRFLFYASPIVLAGALVALASIVQVCRIIAKRFIKKSGHDYNATAHSYGRGFGKTQHAGENQGVINAHRLTIWGFLTILVSSIGLVGPFPKPQSLIPPPVIPANELITLNKTLDKSRPPPEYILVSWWDYGHEIRYRTQATVLTDGSNPASIKSLYIAKALTSPNADYSADELRIAAYFDESTLERAYPNRPDVHNAVGIDRDIFLVLPGDLQFKMPAVLGIAHASLPRGQTEGYNPQFSLFTRLYHDRPETAGPFQLVSSPSDALVIYRLRGFR